MADPIMQVEIDPAGHEQVVYWCSGTIAILRL